MARFQEDAKIELATNMVPAPEDLLADIGPLGQVFYLRELGWQVLRSYSGMIQDSASIELKDEDPPVLALQELMMIMGELDGLCVTLELIDPIESVK